MAQQETVTLTGTYESRVAQLLRAARHQARLAQAGARPRMQDALTELEDALSDQLGALESAAEADLAGEPPKRVPPRRRNRWIKDPTAKTVAATSQLSCKRELLASNECGETQRGRRFRW
jgi:hypothetical protein